MSEDRHREHDDRAAEKRPKRVVSLLGQRPAPGEAPPSGEERGEGARPDRDQASGADPLRSAHSTFRDLEAPRDDFDPERARAVCAQVARDLLRDFAPALVLLPAPSRTRAQAILAYARTLLDFARDRSLEGERLAQINRFEFALEAALGGEPVGQPVFVQMAALEAHEPWAREALDGFAAIARSRVSVGVPAKPAVAEAQRRKLTRTALHALLGGAPQEEVEALGAAILRSWSLLGWHEALWFQRPDLGLTADDAPSQRFVDTVAAEARAILDALAAPSGALDALPRRLQPAARFTVLAAAALARRAAQAPESDTAPRLGACRRLGLLLRARAGS